MKVNDKLYIRAKMSKQLYNFLVENEEFRHIWEHREEYTMKKIVKILEKEYSNVHTHDLKAHIEIAMDVLNAEMRTMFLNAKYSND